MTVVEQEIRFHTLSGELSIHRNGNLYEMDFPTYELREIPVTDAMEKAFGVRPIKAVLGLHLACEFESEDIVRTMNPNQELLMGIECRIQNATAAGNEKDCWKFFQLFTGALQLLFISHGVSGVCVGIIPGFCGR